MNYRDKIQKFSIRKYTVGTFSTVIATLVFLGFNTSQAHAAETNQPASVVKQKQQSNNEQTENRESQAQNSQNSQNGQSLSATRENEQPNISQANLVDQKVAQSSTTNDEQPASQNVNTKKDSATAATTQPDKEEIKHKQNESQSANKNGNDSRAAHVENHEANVVTASDSSDNGNVQHDRNELQAFFDANYHDYRFIDRENADSGTFNYVKGIFDKINTLLGSNDPINNKDLQLAYKELEQAVALIRTMPQRQQTSRRSNRIQTRSVESRAAEPRSVSDYQNANSSYYVENANDGSGYPVGTYINASSKGAPYNLPTTPWNTLKASDSKEIALMTAKQTGDGYQWVIKFNKGHAPHQNMIFWFALPADQVPVGRTDFVTVNSDGTNVQWSHGAGAGANKPLQQMWEYGVNDPDRSHDFKIRNRSGQVIYDWPTVHIYSLEDLSRASDYFSEAGATPATKAFGRQNFEYINGQKPAESPGVPKVYTFIGQGDASYTISFKTQGPTVNKLYYAAGGRALEYNQLFMYSQLYVESTQDHQQRLNGLRQVVNRTYRIGTTKRVEVSQGNVQTKKVLESTNLNIDDFVDDPLSYVKTPSNKVLGFYSTNANTNAFRPGGAQQLNEYQLSQLFTDQKLQEAARTRNPIRLMIGFDYPDAYGNSETLVPVNLTVLPEIQHNIKFFKNDDTQNIAEKPFSKQAGHPVFYVYAGNQGNASVNLGGSVTSIQPLRINLTSNENFTDKDWQITGIPRTLHIENSTNRTNNARERNIELVGNLLPGDYFGTIRFGRKEQLFEIRVKPHTPTITTTAEQLRGTALQKVPVNISGIPLDPSALVYLVAPTNQTTNGGSEADQIPSGYTILATGTPDGVHNTITIQPKDYVVFIPPVGKQIRAVVYYNKVVASNMSNAVTILPDDIPPTINNPVGINAKYYRGDEVNFTMGVSDRHSGLKSTTITTLPSGWTSNLTKSDNKNGSLAITGRVSMNQAFNSDITFKVSATDNVNNTTNDSQSKHVSIHVGKISEDAHPIVLGNTEKVVVVNPTAVSNDEKQRIITAFMNKNQNIRGYLASTDPVTVDNNGNVTLHYRDGSSTTLDATNVMTYEPVVKSEYQTANAAKTATVTIAKGQSFNIGDIKQYFTLSNGQAIPSGTFTNITSDRTIPTAQEVSQMNAGTQLYHIVASNAYHKDTEDFYISLKIVDVKQPEGDQRVYRTSTYDLTTDEISKVKQAFINANRDVITLAEGDISVTNTPNGANVSTITVNINKGRLTKSFASNLANMNFLRWVNFPQDYTVTWTNVKIANRPTDGGLSWSDDHKSLIYRYDATLGTQITTNDILTMLKATTTVPGLRNNITGNEKAQAEAGGRPNYRTTGYSQANASSDGQRQYTLNGQVIQILDIINPSNGYGGQPVTNSNTRANHSNATVVNVNEPAANGAGAFTIDHVVKSNSTHNASDAVYKAQLYLTPYGPKQYVEHLNQNTGNTTDAINIYFVPSDLVNPTISVGNYTNHQVFSGETFTNTITANDNFGVQSVTVPTTSQITGTVDNNHQHVSATAPNVTSATSKTINLLATDTSGNTATTSFNVTVKPLRDKYRVGTSSTAANPVRIANISNDATVSQADQTAIINSLMFTETVPNRNYATASANEITSKTVSNVSRTGNNANVTVTVTYQDGTTSTVTVPVKHVIPEIVAHSHYTVQGQDFPAGNGSSAADYFKLSNGSAIPDATITWVSGQAPNKDNTRIGEDINVTANILIDGETTPITKTATYKVVSSVPKHVFETNRGAVFPGVSDVYDAKQYVKPVNDSWTQNAQRMNFQFTNSYGPSKDVVGISTRDIRVTYDNHQTQIIKILAKVKPDPPRIDGNSVTYKAGLTNQQIKINNVLSSSSIKLFKADNTPLTITNTTYGSGNTAVVTVSDALPNGVIKARSSITMNNVTYTTQDEHGRAIDVTRNESVDSNDSATVTVTPQLQATTEGAVFIKGGDGFDFGHVERFIQNPPHGATVAWHDNPDTWKNTVGNTHKTAVVTLPSGQGTRNVEVPVKVYPVANAKAPSRDVKGQNLTNGTDAINYITFDPNTNTNGITAAWANRQQPNNQQAGVQHLNVDVTYPGITAAKRVPVTVNVYQFEFPQTSYTTTVGGTLANGTQASGYAHMQNANGLPTDGFTYKWNNAATGTNDANWAAMNKPNAAKVVNAKYDVIYNGHTFATSLPAKFVVKDVQPAKPTVTETAAGAITITPGANQTVNTHAGNVTTYADKLVIKRNGNVVTIFTRRNNTSPWVKEASAATVAGIAGTNNGITVTAGTFNPADTIQVVATQGSGETISDEQRSDDFTVVAPQPNHANTKIWQNGHIDITPNNPSGHLINPTQAMDIAYTEKMGNGAEHSKTINVVRGQNNQWTIANKPDYVTLDAHTGKVTFNANTVKPNSAITITPKAGTGHSASSNPSTLTAPATHTVNTTEIVKDYGSNVTAAEINNAVQVANKRTATIKNGTAMPTNLAGGSTTTIPVTVTYNDGSTEEVQESIFTKADKRELITAKNHLDDPVSTDGKKPGTITQYNNAIHNAQQQINTAKTEAQQVINNERATPQQVSDALTKVRAAQTKINEAKALLQNKEDNSQLVTSKNNLQSSVNQVPSTTGMTQQSIDNYNAKKREAETEITAAQRVIDNGDATAQQISDENTTAQRNDLTNQISQATNLAAVESVKQSANSLDGAMGNLQTAINDKSGTLASQNFLDADEQKRNAYNQAVSNAETILNKQTGPNTAKTAVEQALNNVNSAKHALNGTQNLNNAKQAAITAINGASDLNQKQKDALKAQANGAQRVSNAQDVQRNATELNTAMGTLKHAIADKTNTLASSKYVNADSTKQNAYTTKVTNAEHIISGTPTVVTTPSEVTAAANQVNSAKQELNGDERLRVAKQNANTAIDALTQLNTPQKAKLKEQVGQANRLEDIQTVQTNGQALNNAMKGLRDSIANETTVKASQNYTDASPNNQSTYNSAVSNAKGIINQTNNPTMDTSAITQATTQVNNAKNGLNGAENLRNAQNTAKQNLNTLSHLTNNQKSAISSQIDRAGHVSEVTAAKNAATELNTQMGNLEQAIHDQNTVKQGVNFTDADKAKRDAYTNAVSRAETILNKTQGANTSKQDVEAAIQNVTSAKNALNGDQNVTNAKNTAKHALNNLTSINNAQKRDLTTKIDQATTVAGVEAVSNTGTQLNTAMANLQNGINDKANTLASENYHDADSDKKTAYTQAVTNAENILNKNSGSNLDKAAVENALSQVTNAKGALNGNHNLEQAKSNANTTINGLQHLTTAQKDKLKQQVQQAQNVAGVDTVKSSANTLNGAMGTLRNSIQDNTATNNGQNYLDATESNKTNYNNAVDSANGVINATSNPNMDANAINQIATQVTSTKNALDGTHNLTQAKQTATNAIDGATNLNKAQKDALKAQVTSAQRVANVTSIQQTANELNTAMGQLQHGIDDENATKQTQKYRDAEQSKKTAYDQAVAAAKAILNKQTGSNSDKAAVDRALQQVTSTKDALNGDAKLAEAKAAAKQNLGTLNHITNAQRTALEGQINQATTVDGVNTVKTNANTLDGAMNSLQGSINDKDATLRNQNYLDADESKRNAYTQAVTAAEGILNKQTGGNTSKADVDNALNTVTRAKAALNGAENLRNTKTSATNTINGLPNLTQLQKDNLKHQVEQAQNVAGVNGVKDKGNTLNTAMGALRTSIQNDNTTKTSQNYLDASDSNKNNYNTAVNNANGVINVTNNPNMDANAINGMANQVNTTKAALNGAQNLAQAKTTAKNNLNNLTSINNAQKDALTRSIDGATTVAGVNQETAKATELNNAMHSLQNGINDETQTKQTQKYLDAGPSKKSAYDQAVNAAKAILTKASGQNVDKAAVEQALQNVNSTKTALNGDAKLNEAKAAAKQTLGTLTHINNAQRTALDNEITQATNVEGVNTVKAKAQQLDGAMGQLETSIRDKDTTLQSQNYQDADDAKRTAYSQAVNAAATILNKTAGGNTPKADVERAMQAVTQANTALNGIQNLERAKQAANTAITNASDLNTKQKEALKAQVTSAGRVSAANGVEHTATELNTAMTALKHAIADKAETKASGNYVNADANKRQAYDEKVTAAENIVSGTPTPTLTPSDVTNAATQVTNAKTQLNGNHNLEVAKQNANTAIDGLTSLNGPQKAKLKEQVGQATTLPNVQTVRDNAQTLNTAMKGLRDSIANEATIKADQNYTDASQNKQTDYNNAVTAAKAIIGQTTSPTMNAQEINQAKDQVTAKQQALNGQENLRTAQTNAKQHLNGLSDLTNAQKDAAKRQIEGATHVNEVTQAQNNADVLNTAMTNLKNGIQDQNTIKQGVNFTDADEAKRNAYTNAVTQAEQILNKAQGPNTAKDNVETALQNVQRAKSELNGNQNVANAKTTAKNTLNNLTSINNAQKAALKSQIEGATTVAGVNQVSAKATELNTAMSNLQSGINDEAATKAAQKYTDADREKQTAYNDAVTAAKTLLDKTAGSNDNKAAVEQALQRVNTAKTALNGDARLNEAKNTAKQQLATMSHLTNAQKANLTSQIERGTTVAGVQGIQANAGTLDQAMNQLRQSIASKDATKSSEDYQDANADLQNAYNHAVSDAEGIISATNNPEMNPDTINQKASQVNSAKSALNGDEKLAAAKQSAKTDIGHLSDLNNAQQTSATAEVDNAPNLAAVTSAKNKATSLNTAMGNLKHALAEKDNTKRSVNYTDADQPKQQAYDTAVTQAEAITNANGSNANETQVQAALNQLNQAKNDLNGDNKVAQAKEAAKRALASYSNLNNAQSTAATSQIDNATTVAGVTAAQNTANELNTAMGQLQNGINDQNTVKQQVNFTDADQGKKDAYTNAVTNAQGILDKAHGQNMTKAQVEAALNQVTTAKNALNGDANVRQAKSDAKANLGTLTHLNNAQKQDLTSQIEGATTVNGVNGVKTKAQDLDGAMQRLESAIANKDQTKASENYIDAYPTKKTAFDNAITQAESYLNKDHGANKDKQAVEQAIQSVTTAKNALNGDANLQRAKTEATQAIDNLTHLNTPQKTALKQQVNAAQRVSGVTDLKNSATSLNNAMDQLKQAIADHDTIVAGGNYTNASPDKQGAYTDAYNAAKNIVNGSPNVITNAADVTAATQRVNNAETGLNGDTNLATAKQQAKDALRQMTHLSDAQKQSITGQIDSATQVTGVQSVKDNATNLDNAMNQLRNSIANKDEVKASQPYVDADTDKQNAYNTAVTSAENIINATSQPTLDPSAVTQAANQVNTNKTALNGAQNLANKKQETTANINQLSHLNNAQNQDLNTQVTNAPNISTVNQVKTKAEQLDQAMERLINGIQDKDQVKQSVNFTDADPEKQTAYNNAVTAAENIINQANGTNANQSQVEAALSTVTTTKQALNGDRKVTDAKNNANQTLSTLDNLNNAQKGAVTENINQAHTVAEVTQAIQTAQELNTAMGNLKNSLNDKDTTLGSQNFADADPEKKNAYNEAVRNAENILNKSTGTNVPKDQVEAAMNQVNTTKAALNGTQNLEKAKQHANTAIDGLSHLTNAQKDALKQLVQQSTTVAEAQGNEQKANNVDAAMDKLRQSIADNATTKQNQNYTDASPNKKDAYNNAVTTAQGIIDQTTSPTLDPNVINQAAGQVNTTKNALNGNENLEAAKQQATQSLGSLDNLNNAQKQAVTNQINGAHTVDEANQIKQNAQNLNTAMGNLKQAIADKDATKATVNFTDADQAKQQAYNTAVTNAENIISKANGGNATQSEVEQAIQQVNATKHRKMH
ncbi:extracellular matrix binding protein [Staphylococcus aureus]|nr:extracellular matrix binding protein [Staphylococcus aureus]SUK11346.1 extracellular matrix binding protein [Staphylococcus aureus]